MSDQHIASVNGRHVIADIYDLSAREVENGQRLLALLTDALKSVGFNVIEVLAHQFTERGAGFTGIVLLAESHAALHTYPEYGYIALDVFSCGRADPLKAVEAFAATLGPACVRTHHVER